MSQHAPFEASHVLRRGVEALVAQQQPDGRWQAEDIEVGALDWDASKCRARLLAGAQMEDGRRPEYDACGIFFFSTPLIHSRLFRSYFPVWALGLSEAHRHERFAAAAS